MKANVQHKTVRGLSPLSKIVFSFRCKSEAKDSESTERDQISK